MVAINNYIKVSLGIGLTWVCVAIFSHGFGRATVDHVPLVYPAFQGNNLLFFTAAPVAQTLFYILARKIPWLLNVYVTISALCCLVFWFHLSSTGGYRFTYWHQGDLNCVQGCDDVWIFGGLVFLQGCILMFASCVFEAFADGWQIILRLVLAALLLWLLITSFQIVISM